MRTILSLIASLVLLTSMAEAQSNEQNVGASIGFGNELTSLRAEYDYYLGLGTKKKLKLGVGARIVYGLGNDLRYAEVNTDNFGDGSETENALLVEEARIGGLNAILGLKYSFNEKWDLGFRLDIIGVGFGANQGGTYQSNDDNDKSVLTTKAPNPNIAFTRGQVTSDNLWIGYTFKKKHQLTLALAFFGTEYELEENTLDWEDPRFERIHQMFFLGYNYRF